MRSELAGQERANVCAYEFRLGRPMNKRCSLSQVCDVMLGWAVSFASRADIHCTQKRQASLMANFVTSVTQSALCPVNSQPDVPEAGTRTGAPVPLLCAAAAMVSHAISIQT